MAALTWGWGGRRVGWVRVSEALGLVWIRIDSWRTVKNIMKMCLLAKGTKMAATQSDVTPPPFPAPINWILTQHHQSDRCYNRIFNALICGQWVTAGTFSFPVSPAKGSTFFFTHQTGISAVVMEHDSTVWFEMTLWAWQWQSVFKLLLATRKNPPHSDFSHVDRGYKWLRHNMTQCSLNIGVAPLLIMALVRVFANKYQQPVKISVSIVVVSA